MNAKADDSESKIIAKAGRSGEAASILLASLKRVPVHWERRTNGRAASLILIPFPLPYNSRVIV